MCSPRCWNAGRCNILRSRFFLCRKSRRPTNVSSRARLPRSSSIRADRRTPQEALMKDRVEYKRSKEIPGLVLSEARFSEFRFDRHYHLDYHIALVTEGVQRQGFHGETLLLTPGSIQLMPPGEVHDGN